MGKMVVGENAWLLGGWWGMATLYTPSPSTPIPIAAPSESDPAEPGWNGGNNKRFGETALVRFDAYIETWWFQLGDF